MPYYEGQPVPLSFTLTDVSGNAVQAASTPPVVTVTLPDGTTATPSVTFNSGPKTYTATYDTTQAGHHEVAWTCTDATYPGGFTDVFDVWPLTSTNVLQESDALATLGFSTSASMTALQLSQLREFSAGITDWLEWYCGPIVQQTVTEELPAGGLMVQLSKPPVLALETWTQVPAQLNGYPGFSLALANSGPMFPTHVFGVAYPLNQLFVSQKQGWVVHTSALPFYFGQYIWQYTAGYASIPYTITYAARVLLRHLWALERGGAGGVGLGAADEETTPGPLGFMVPNRLLEALVPYGQPAAIA